MQKSPRRKNKENKKDLKDIWSRAKDMVDKVYPDFHSIGQNLLDNPGSFSSNISFSRTELIDLYTKFKSLCLITIENYLRNMLEPPQIGTNYDNFRESMPEGLTFNTSFLSDIFFRIDRLSELRLQGVIDW
jgi:hypothetical protein